MKRLGIIAAWVGATFLTAMVAWSAVNLAGEQVSDRPVLPLSSAEVGALPVTPATFPPEPLPSATAPSSTALLPPTTVAPRSSVATTTSPAVPTTSPATPTTSLAATTSTPAPGSTSTTSTTAVAASSTTSTSQPTTTTTPTTIAASPEVSVYTLVGGVVSIESSPGTVTLISAGPTAGFSVDVKSFGPEEVEVEFESATHESRFRARWDGRLVATIDEEPDEDGGED